MPGANRVKRAKWKQQPAKKRGEMNLTEKRFEQNVLWPRQLAGEVSHWHFEQFKVRLADGAYYTPDFWIFNTDGTIECAEVKGAAGFEEASRVRIKVAADRYPEFLWRAYTEGKGSKNRGNFTCEEFS